MNSSIVRKQTNYQYSVVGFFMPGRRVSSDNSIHTFVNKCSISRILHV
nr:MAG TPA: hypothetical protein [Bacteriophage sp.]